MLLRRLVHTSLCSTARSFTGQLSGSMQHAFAGRWELTGVSCRPSRGPPQNSGRVLAASVGGGLAVQQHLRPRTISHVQCYLVWRT